VKPVKEQDIISELETWERDKGSLPPVLQLYRKLLGIQAAARAQIVPPALRMGAAEIKAALLSGRPMLGFNDLPLDWGLFPKVLKETTAAVEDSLNLKSGLSGLPGEIATLKPLVEDWYRGRTLSIYGENEYIVELVVHNAVKPFLSSAAEPLAALIDQELWLRNLCPVCGGLPDFSFLEKERGARHLVCSRCDTAWLFKRMECPYCANQHQEHLAYFTSDNGLYRLYVCEKCKNYLKAVDLRVTEKPILLPLERLMTLDLDEQACGKGYSIHNHSRGFTNQKSVAIEG
jgi:hypothetical protein